MPAWPLGRLVAVVVFLTCLTIPQAAASTSPPVARGGERGSGPATWSVQGAFGTDDVRWSDVPLKHWARTAIDFVGATNDWMRDKKAAADGRYAFQPDRLENRRLFARALFRAFGSGVAEDPALRFSDLPESDAFYRFANVAVTARWMETDDAGAFRPLEPVTMREVHRALVFAIGMGDLAAGVDALHLKDGTPVPTPKDLGTLLIGMRIGLRFNHGDESLDVGPDSPLHRAEVAWSLYRAANQPSWMHDSLSPYATMQLPNLSAKLQRVIAFAVRYVGYPYVWGGEWHQPSPSGYCCGSQPIGGFDCSGLTWWLMKKAVTGWNPTPPRAYAGWDLHQRTSASMASVGTKVTWNDKRPGDLLFYDGDHDGTVDHVDTYVGNEWAIDSGSGNGGVTFTYVGSGSWYEEHFVHARRIVD